VPALPESILVGTNALHFVLRAFVSTRMCHACVTGGTRSLKYWYPTKLSLTTGNRYNLRNPHNDRTPYAKLSTSAPVSRLKVEGGRVKVEGFNGATIC
jgi:hypothetical protein